MSAEYSVDAAFDAWVATLPAKHWAKYDISACRLGWEAQKANRIKADDAVDGRIDFKGMWNDMSDRTTTHSPAGVPEGWNHMQPAYYVKHPDGSFSMADPQPLEVRQ